MRIWRRVAGLATAAAVVMAAGITSGVANATGAAPARAATGTPIKIGGFFEIAVPAGQAPFPETAAAAKGAVAGINKRGGVDGHPIELIVCDTKADPNVAAACARDMISQKVMAVIYGGRFATAWMPITSAAGIPFIGTPAGTIEATNALAYNITAGNFGNNGGAAAVAVDIGKSKKPVVAHADTPTAAASMPAFDQILSVRGLPAAKKIPITVGIVDQAPYAATITSGGYDSVYMGMTVADADKLVLAIRQTGSKIKIVRSLATFPETSIQTLGANAQGILAASQFKLVSSKKDPEVKRFLKELKQADPNVAANALAQGAWSAVYTFADAAKSATALDSASLKTVLDSGKEFAAPMTSGTVQFKTPNAAIGQPRIFNVTQTYAVVKNGKLVTANDDQFIDPFVPQKKKGSRNK